MISYKIEYYPMYTTIGGQDWRIADYRKRIYNKINKEKIRNGDYDLIRLEHVDRIVKLAIKKFKCKTELEALMLINRELTLKQIKGIANAKIEQKP